MRSAAHCGCRPSRLNRARIRRRRGSRCVSRWRRQGWAWGTASASRGWAPSWRGTGACGRWSRRRPRVTQPERPAPQRDEPPKVAIRSKLRDRRGKVTVPGFVEEQRDGRTRPTARSPRTTTSISTWTSAADMMVPRPYAYIIPGPDAAFRDCVRPSSATASASTRPARTSTSSAPAYTIDAVTKAIAPLPGALPGLRSRPRLPRRAQRVPRRLLLVSTSQPLGNLATYLLEPSPADGLTTWNFFDEALKIGEAFPVLPPREAGPDHVASPAAALPEDRKPKQAITFDLVFESDRPAQPQRLGDRSGLSTGLTMSTSSRTRTGRQYKVEAATGRAEPLSIPSPIAAALGKLPTIEPPRRRVESPPPGSSTGTRTASAFVFDHHNDLYYCKMDGSDAAPPDQFAAARGAVVAQPRWQVRRLRPRQRSVGRRCRHAHRAGPDHRRHRHAPQRQGRLGLLRGGLQPQPADVLVVARFDAHRVFYEIDSSPIKIYTIVNDIPEGQDVESTPYPQGRPAQPDARSSHRHGRRRRARSEIDLSRLHAAGHAHPERRLVPRFLGGLSPTSANRTQTWLDLLSCPPMAATRPSSSARRPRPGSNPPARPSS